MHRLLRFYNQNRMKIWALILGVIFILLVIQVFNSIARKDREEQNSTGGADKAVWDV